MHYELNNVEEVLVFGLRCPDGTVLWPPQTYKGYEFDTAERRNGFADILRGMAAEIKIDPEIFVRAFSWTSLTETTTVFSKLADDALDMASAQWEIPQAEQESNDGETGTPAQNE